MPDYEAMLEQYYRTLLTPGSICVDVGAHTGRHAGPIAACAGPTGLVHAFEPLPEINARLRAAVANLPPGSAPVVVHDFALGTEQGVADFVVVHELPEYSGFKTRIYDSAVTTSTIQVTIARMDRVLSDIPRLDYIKVDAEGGEYSVLGGASGLIQKFRPVITFEFGDNALVNYPHNSGDMYDMLSGWGYRIEDINRVALDRAAFVESSAAQRVWDYIALPSAS